MTILDDKRFVLWSQETVVYQFELRLSEGRRLAGSGAAASLTAAKFSLRHSRSGGDGWGDASGVKPPQISN